MVNSIISGKKGIRLWVIFFWLAVWEIAARWIGQEILLVSPVVVFRRFLELIASVDFWKISIFSIWRIGGGFLLAFICSLFFAALSSVYQPVRAILQLPVSVIKAAPVASFAILILIWVPSRNLSVIISFMMVFPVVYTSVLKGIMETDRELLEMAQVFGLSHGRKIRYIYLSELIPFITSSCSVALGLCWKAGVAAEVIGIPDGSIGEKLYEAKIYLETPDLFAWTLAIIIFSVLFEWIFLLAAEKITKMISGWYMGGD